MNEEAITILKREFSEYKDTISVYARKRKKAFDMAIQALEQQPSEENREWDGKIDGLPNTIHYSDECLKFRHKNYVLYNVEWLKENYQQELKLLGVEQPKEEDCISRQAVLDGLASIAKAKAKSDAQKSLMGRVMFFTEHLPSVTPQQRWLPVSERLPENNKEVLCYSPFAGIFIGTYFEGVFDGDSGWTDDVVAYMPLPQPYKAESEESEE